METNANWRADFDWDALRREWEEWGQRNGWTTDRHIAFATTDIPMRHLPRLQRLWERSLFPRTASAPPGPDRYGYQPMAANSGLPRAGSLMSGTAAAGGAWEVSLPLRGWSCTYNNSVAAAASAP